MRSRDLSWRKTRNFSFTVDVKKKYSQTLQYERRTNEGEGGFGVTKEGDGIQYAGSKGTVSASVQPAKEHQ